MKAIFTILFKAEGARPLFVILCLVLSSLAEAASIGSLLPVIAAMSGSAEAESSGLSHAIRSFVRSAGIEPSLGSLLMLVVGFMLLKAFLTFSALSYAGISAARVSIALRRRLVAAVFDAKWSFYSDQRGGRFANTISNDAGRAGDAYLLAAQVVAYGLQAVAYVGVAILINWRLAIVGALASSMVILILGQLIRITRRASFKQTDRTSALTVFMVDMLANIKPLKSSQRYDAMLATITRTLNRLRRSLVTRELSKAGLVQGSDAVTAILVGSGAYVAHTWWRTPLPELLVSGVIFFQIVAIMSKLLKFLQAAAQHESSYVRTMEMVTMAEGQKEDHRGTLTPTIGDGFRYEHVDFAHGETDVLSDVSFTIPARAITVFSGPSGSGKTSLIDLLIGLNIPSRGRILIGDTPLTDIDMRAWRHTIGYVPQELNLFHASVRDNITLSDAAIADEDVLAALEQAGATAFIANLPDGLDTDVGEMGGKLSGGQRQRISLARALVTRPQVLILDEVTSALDPATESEIVGNIASLRGKFTIIVITHRSAWTAIADRLYKVSHGKVSAARRASSKKVTA